MLRWSLTVFIVAIFCAILGFGGLAGSLAGLAKILFLFALVAAVVSMVSGNRVSV